MNALLTSLVTDVYSLTKRPDLVSETALAVRNATLKAHNSDYYYKDLFETGIQFPSLDYQQDIEYKTLVPNWRALKYLRKYLNSTSDPTQAYAGEYLQVMSPENLVDSYGVNLGDVCYVAGLELHVRSKTPIQYALLGCYVYPNVTPDLYNSWIAQEHEAAILYEAALTIFKTIGYDEQVAAYQKLVDQEYALLKQNQLQAQGY